MDKRIITTDVTEEDFSLEGNLRPQSLDEYISQADRRQIRFVLWRIIWNRMTVPSMGC